MYKVFIGNFGIGDEVGVAPMVNEFIHKISYCGHTPTVHMADSITQFPLHRIDIVMRSTHILVWPRIYTAKEESLGIADFYKNEIEYFKCLGKKTMDVETLDAMIIKNALERAKEYEEENGHQKAKESIKKGGFVLGNDPCVLCKKFYIDFGRMGGDWSWDGYLNSGNE